MSEKVTRKNGGYKSTCEHCGVLCEDVQVYQVFGHPSWGFLCGRCWNQLRISG
jgi:hypothetical protein